MSMLEQAIIDADELRKSAIKLAEQKVIEKHSSDFKAALDVLMEQQMGEFGDEMEPEPGSELPGPDDLDVPGEEMAPDSMGAGLELGEEEVEGYVSDEISEQMPLAASKFLDGEDMDEEIEIDFSELESQFQNPQGSFEGVTANIQMTDNAPMPSQAQAPSAAPMQEQDEIFEEMFREELEKELAESCDFENEVVPSGHPGPPTEQEYDYAQDVMKLKVKLQESKEKYDNVVRLANKQKDAIKQLAEQMSKTGLLNARLLYSNKVLGSNSLNERQKKAFIENISKAKNVEQAKVIFETLRSTIGESSTKKDKTSKLLRETFQTKTKSMQPQINESEKRETANPLFNRWKAIVGN